MMLGVAIMLIVSLMDFRWILNILLDIIRM